MKDRWIAWAVTGCIVGSTFSIAVASTFLGLAISLWLAIAFRDRRLGLEFPPFGWLLLAYCLAVVLSIAFSTDPIRSSKYFLKLLKFLLVPLVYTFFTTRDVRWTLRSVLVLLAASAGLGLLQYFWLIDVHLMNRIRGFMSHWMTFSGQLMLAGIALAALILFGPRRGKAREPLGVWIFFLLVVLSAVLLTFTRNAWIGVAAGIGLLLLFFRWKLILPAGLALAALLFLTANPFRDRILSGFDLNDTTTQTRVELFQTGRSLIAEHPWTGVGPRMIPLRAPEFRYSDRFEDSLYVHLHNSALQVTAETGLLSLAPWILLWGYLAWDLLRLVRASRGYQRCLALNALCALIAFHLAGLFEYNFGDAEVLVLLLFFVTAPYVVQRETEKTS